MYWNQSLVDAKDYGPYSDALEPRVFGNASPFDPAIFLTMNEYAEELLEGKASGKYTPVDVAQWIEDFAAAGRKALGFMPAYLRENSDYVGMRVDVEIQAGLGEFFGAKFRSGVLFHLYEVSKERTALEASIAQYRKARAAWAGLAKVATGVYVRDVTVGEQNYLRGHWMDRLPAIDKDIAALEAMPHASAEASPKIKAAIAAVLGRPQRARLAVRHAAPERFVRGEGLELALEAGAETAEVRLHYRHVDQAENYVAIAMERRGSKYVASVPAEYTKTEFPLQYFFEVRGGDGKAGLHPGFTPELTNQPYFVVRSKV
jgi:hypothetical protein